MKYLLLTLALCTTMNAKTISKEEHLSLHPKTFKKTDMDKIYQLNQIDDKQAIAIAKDQCKEDNIKIILKHHNRYIYYIATTPNCKIYINALDGKILTAKNIKTKKEM